MSILPLGNLRRRRAPVLTRFGKGLLIVAVVMLLGIAAVWIIHLSR